MYFFFFFFSSRRRHTRSLCDWSSDVCSSDLTLRDGLGEARFVIGGEQRVRPQLRQIAAGEIDRALTRGSGAPNQGSPPGETRRMEIGGRCVGSNVVS